MADDKNGPSRGFGALGGMVTKAEEATKDLGGAPAPRPAASSLQRATPPETGSSSMPTRQVATASTTAPSSGKMTPLRATAIGIGVWMGILVLVMIVGSAGRQKSASDRARGAAGGATPSPGEWEVVPDAPQPSPASGNPWDIVSIEDATSPAPQPLPASGVMYTYGSFGGPNRPFEAPFEIKAGQGSHFLVKLVHVGTNQPAMTIFVRSGETVEVEVPLGTFEVRYASGDTWYGDDLLFGPETSYSKADTFFTFEIVGNQIRGFTITLYTVAHGNLKTKAIGASEF